jgi:aminoglycoside phosphotransferase (APT) family kinase protein
VINDPELIPIRADEGLDTARLEAYLRGRLPVAEGPLTIGQFGGGHANLTYLLRFGETEYVLRRPPLGPIVASSHDMSREHRVLSRLHRVFDLAPECHLLCDDTAVIGAEFMVMERRVGRVIRLDLPARFLGDPELARRIGEMLIDSLAALHRVDAQGCGLGDLGRPEGFVARQLEGWTGRWRQAMDQENPAMDRLISWLESNRPDPRETTLIHNDYKLDNMLVGADDPDRAVALLDWDMCTRGDPLMDLGYLLNYWVEPGDPHEWRAAAAMPTWRPGFPSRAEAAARYGEKTGFALHDLLWYRVFGAFKIAVVLQQIYIRWRRGQTQDQRFADMGERVETLIEKGLALAGER